MVVRVPAAQQLIWAILPKAARCVEARLTEPVVSEGVGQRHSRSRQQGKTQLPIMRLFSEHQMLVLDKLDIQCSILE